MTNEQLQKLYESQQLGEATATNPTQLLRTALFYVTLSTSANVAEKVNENLKTKCCAFEKLRREDDTTSSVQCCPRKTIKVGSMATQRTLNSFPVIDEPFQPLLRTLSNDRDIFHGFFQSSVRLCSIRVPLSFY